jgi:uncharacterized protein YecT (DUF1311 family)
MTVLGSFRRRTSTPTASRLLSVLAAVLSVARAAGAGDPTDDLAGTWGVPPNDAQIYPSGSYFSLYRSASGEARADLALYGQGWNCSMGEPVAWNPGSRRYEWPNRAMDAKEACWFTAAREGDRLHTTIKCAYQCTDREHEHTVVLDHIAAARLQPPPDVVITFCASHDALRQQLCVPGPIQDAARRATEAASVLRTLGDGDTDPKAWEAKSSLLAIVAECHAASGDATCLASRTEATALSLAKAIEERRRALASERAASQAAETELTRGEEKLNVWQGQWIQVNDVLVSGLRLESCTPAGCNLALFGLTNYTFGPTQERRGSCTLDLPIRFTGGTTAYGYLEPDNAASAGPFEDYCRVDLKRTLEGVAVDLHGVGCGHHCMDVSEGHVPLRGTYAALQQASFDCSRQLEELGWEWDEQLICRDAALAALDRELASVYALAKTERKDAALHALVAAQKAWLTRRRATCAAQADRTSCLAATYRARLKQLEAGTRRPQ